jgi:hypothetical protein
MTRSKFVRLVLAFLISIAMANCNTTGKSSRNHFDDFSRTINVDNWQFSLNVENQNKKAKPDSSFSHHYLKATVYLSNSKTKKSLLYAISENSEDYEAKYKYLSFSGKDDLFIKHNDEFIYPIGYVFEPSNGLSTSERLVYKFQIDDNVYKKLLKDNEAVEYWYVDRLVGLGKICFTHNN